ncbi:MAG: hypothetical protein ACP5IL_14310 [Syntrophobacteraceae bacterium]
MERSSRKMNFLIEETICRDLTEMIPPGKRSHVVNEALRKELEHIRRQLAVQKLIELSGTIRKFSTREIVEELTGDRSSH